MDFVVSMVGSNMMSPCVYLYTMRHLVSIMNRTFMLSPTGQYETAPALIEHLSQPALLLIASIFCFYQLSGDGSMGTQSRFTAGNKGPRPWAIGTLDHSCTGSQQVLISLRLQNAAATRASLLVG